MVKSLHKLLVVKSEQDYQVLVDFFDALGLAHGEAWKGRRSQGVKLEAPQAGVEIGMGQGFPAADLVVEVDSADTVYALVQQRGFKVAEQIADSDWGARLFTLQMPAGAGRLAVFSYAENWRKDQASRATKLDAAGRRFGIVVSRFNAFITERLLAGALDALRRCGSRTQDIEVVRVPGSFEIPAAARTLAQTGRVDAVICLGCIMRGQTTHYEHLANEVTRGIGQSAQETAVPHAYGVITCENLEQAIDRAGLKSGNKGWDAALSAVEMAGLKEVGGRHSPAKAKISRSSHNGNNRRDRRSTRKQGRKKSRTRHA